MLNTPESHDKPRNAHLEARVFSDQKDFFRRAATLTERTLSELVIDSTQEAAAKIEQGHEIICLSREEQVTFVSALLTPPSSPKVLGFYTLSSSIIRAGELPEELMKRLPRYGQLPVTLLGRLAVDRSVGGRGVGEFPLVDAASARLSAVISDCWGQSLV